MHDNDKRSGRADTTNPGTGGRPIGKVKPIVSSKLCPVTISRLGSSDAGDEDPVWNQKATTLAQALLDRAVDTYERLEAEFGVTGGGANFVISRLGGKDGPPKCLPVAYVPGTRSRPSRAGPASLRRRAGRPGVPSPVQ